MQPKAEAKKLIKKFGSNKAIELCNYFMDGQMEKVHLYWKEVREEIKNTIKEL